MCWAPSPQGFGILCLGGSRTAWQRRRTEVECGESSLLLQGLWGAVSPGSGCESMSEPWVDDLSAFHVQLPQGWMDVGFWAQLRCAEPEKRVILHFGEISSSICCSWRCFCKNTSNSVFPSFVNNKIPLKMQVLCYCDVLAPCVVLRFWCCSLKGGLFPGTGDTVLIGCHENSK